MADIVLTDDQTPAQPDIDYSRLSHADIATALRLSADGRSQRDIAQVIGCHHSSIARLQAEFGDTTFLAKSATRHEALRLAKATVEGAILSANLGRVTAGLELLDRLDVVNAKRDHEDKSSKILIQIGSPSQPIGPDPLLIESKEKET